MDAPFTAIVCAPDVPATVGAAMLGRATEGPAEVLVFPSEELPRFFDDTVQQKLPRGYRLAICGLEVVHIDWDGRLVRPVLMERLRKFVGGVRWYSTAPWEAEDRRAIAHMIGEENLIVSETADSVAALVRERRFGPDAEYEGALARFASSELTPSEETAWGADLRRVIASLKADRHALERVVAAMMERDVEGVIAEHGAEAERVEQQNRRYVQENAEEARRTGTMDLVCLELPPDRHAFWAEMGGYAREAADAELSLCRLLGRPVMLLCREPDVRVDLRVWTRYVTDLLAAARTAGARPDVVPLVVRGLSEDPGLKREVLSLLKDGAHLLRNQIAPH